MDARREYARELTRRGDVILCNDREHSSGDRVIVIYDECHQLGAPTLHFGPTMSQSSQTLDQTAATFAAIVRRYCAFIERASTLTETTRLHQARRLLAELVHVACQLPSDTTGPNTKTTPLPQKTWSYFSTHEWYYEVFDPYVEEPPVRASLSDDLLDIYSDLRRGLVAYDAGHVGTALWQWRFNFDIHWGNHAVDALRALQRACSG